MDQSSNKEGTKIELQRDITQIGLQVVYCGLFAGSLQFFYISTFPMILPTDGQTLIQRCVDASKKDHTIRNPHYKTEKLSKNSERWEGSGAFTRCRWEYEDRKS